MTALPKGQGSSVVDATEQLRARVPKHFLLGPIFAARKQMGPRSVQVGDKIYRIGGVHPTNDNKAGVAFDVRHGCLIFAILSFFDWANPKPQIHFSLSELCRRYASSKGGHFTALILELLTDLFDGYWEVETPDGTADTYRFITRFKRTEKKKRRLSRKEVEEQLRLDMGRPIARSDDKRANSKQKELWFHGVTLDPEFFGVMMEIADLRWIDLAVLRSLPNKYAQAFYLYLPSRAHHHTKSKPWRIGLKKAMEQIDAFTSTYEARANRKQFFMRYVAILDGKKTNSGTFRIQLELNNDKSDFNLVMWTERVRNVVPFPKGAFAQDFIAGGGTPDQFRELMIHRSGELDGYDIDAMERSGFEYEGNERAWEQLKKLFGSEFSPVLGSAKNYILEQQQPIKTNPTAVAMSFFRRRLRKEDS